MYHDLPWVSFFWAGSIYIYISYINPPGFPLFQSLSPRYTGSPAERWRWQMSWDPRRRQMVNVLYITLKCDVITCKALHYITLHYMFIYIITFTLHYIYIIDSLASHYERVDHQLVFSLKLNSATSGLRMIFFSFPRVF